MHVPPETVPGFLGGVVIASALSYRMGLTSAHDNPRAVREHLRGAIVSVARRIRGPRPTGITLAGIPVSPDDETKHF